MSESETRRKWEEFKKRQLEAIAPVTELFFYSLIGIEDK